LKCGLVLGLAVFVGCGPEKELPKEITISTGRERISSPVPPTSEPDALKITEKAIRAATDGHPERLERGKVSKVQSEGDIEWVVGDRRIVTNATRRIEAAWPDRVRVSYDLGVGTIRQITLGLRRPIGWERAVADNGASEVNGFDRAREQLLATDVLGQHWMPLLVPLADPAAVVFGAKTVTDDKKQPVDQILLALPGFPTYTLWFDPKTYYLVRVWYVRPDGAGVDETNVLHLSDHKSSGGLMLPGRMRYLKNGIPVEDWKVAEWEFVDSLPDSTFDRPPENEKK
jgi:hypothetical protein